MRKWFNKIAILALASAAVVSCKKDETRVVAMAGTTPALAASTTNVTLTKATENATPITFTLTPANFGFKAAVIYTLQFAKPNTNFTSPYNLQLNGNSTTQAITGKALNIAALNAGLDTTSAQQVQVRLKADIGSGQAPVYSAPITLTVKPYSLNAYLWVPGDYEGWSPATAPRLISINSTGNFEGYVNIPTGGTYQFKLTSDPDWNHTNYGDGGGGTLSTSGGNLTVPAGGYYLIKADLNNNVWSALNTSWSMIGDFNGWSGDADMTYNTTTMVWTATINVPSAGGFKFRSMHSWTFNYGDDGANGTLDPGGANINITAGTHTVTLDLHNPGAYKYTIQ